MKNEAMEILNSILTELEKKQKTWIFRHATDPSAYSQGILEDVTNTINMVKQKMDVLNDGWFKVDFDLIDLDLYPSITIINDAVIPSCKVLVLTKDGNVHSARWCGEKYGWLDLPDGVRNRHIVAWREFPETSNAATKKIESVESTTELTTGEKRLLEQYKATKLTPEMIHVLQERSVAMVETNEELTVANEEMQKSIEAYSVFGDVEDIEKMQSIVTAVDSMSPYLTTFNMLYEYSGRELIQVFKYSDKSAIMYEYSPKEIQERIRLLKNNM